MKSTRTERISPSFWILPRTASDSTPNTAITAKTTPGRRCQCYSHSFSSVDSIQLIKLSPLLWILILILSFFLSLSLSLSLFEKRKQKQMIVAVMDPVSGRPGKSIAGQANGNLSALI